jgi:hypothetical protein
MCRSFLAVAALALVAGVSRTTADAQCTFPHPKSATKFSTSLVQAFYYCGDRGFTGDQSPNTMTEGGIPACKPPFTQAEYYDSTSWRWDELTGQGQVQLQSSSTFPLNPRNPPDDTTDVSIRLKLKGVVDGSGFRVDGRSGFLAIVARVTLNDRADGNMTIVDFPMSAPVEMHQGSGTLKTSIDGLLNGIDQPGLPRCSSVEIVSLGVIDENGAWFADAGLFLP